MLPKEKIKGYIGERHGFIYYTDGRNVYRANGAANVVDVTTGYLVAGRWECSVEHWDRYCRVLYDLPPIGKGGHDAY